MDACSSVLESLRRLGSHIIDLGVHASVLVMLQNWNTGILVSVASGFCLFYMLFPDVQAANLNWQFVSFAVVFPITFFVKNTWTRREQALSLLAQIKGLSLAIYLCNRDWVRPEKLSPLHLQRAQVTICGLLRTLQEYLLVPRLKTRDLFFDILNEKKYRQNYMQRRKHRRKLLLYQGGLSRLASDLRDYGMTPQELIRLGSFHRQLSLNVEKVLAIKDYRTPQGPRSFGRIDSLLMFSVFGVYFAWVGQVTGSTVFGAVMAAGCAQALSIIINIGAQLEDPFNTGTGRDQVNVIRDLSEVIYTIEKDDQGDAESINAEQVLRTAADAVHEELANDDLLLVSDFVETSAVSQRQLSALPFDRV